MHLRMTPRSLCTSSNSLDIAIPRRALRIAYLQDLRSFLHPVRTTYLRTTSAEPYIFSKAAQQSTCGLRRAVRTTRPSGRASESRLELSLQQYQEYCLQSRNCMCMSTKTIFSKTFEPLAVAYRRRLRCIGVLVLKHIAPSY